MTSFPPAGAPTPQTEPATLLSIAELTALWNRAYAGYFVPLSFNEARMQRHIDTGSIALEHSVVLRVAGEPVALSFLGVRGDCGWIGGFGVAPEHRKKGLGTVLAAEHARIIDRLGLRVVRLEVMVQNWARAVYERVGFSIVRRLGIFAGPVPSAPVAAVREVPASMALSALAAQPRDAAPCWQRQPASLEALPRSAVRGFLVGDGARRGGVLLCEPVPGGPLRIHDLAGTEESVSALLTHAVAESGAGEVLLVNEPESTVTYRVLTALGCPEVQSQWEMRRTRPAGAPS